MISVYYLDDEKDLLEMFADSFASPEVSVKIFIDPSALISECIQNPPDLLFLDYRMPTTNGDLVAQKLSPQIPKYLITGDLQVSTIYPFIDIMHKPFDDEKISRAILKHGSKK
jgi:FixJ family two-component response regulator